MGHWMSSKMSAFSLTGLEPHSIRDPRSLATPTPGRPAIPQANRAPLARGVSLPPYRTVIFSLSSVKGNHNFSQLINVESFFSLQASAHRIIPLMYTLSG